MKLHMNKLIYGIVATTLLLGRVMFAHAVHPTTTSLPTTSSSAEANKGTLHSSYDARALPNGDVDEGNSAE